MYILCLYVLRESQETHVEPQVTQAEDGKKAVGMTAFSWLKVQNKNGQSAMQLIVLNGKLVILCPQLIRTSIPVD